MKKNLWTFLLSTTIYFLSCNRKSPSENRIYFICKSKDGNLDTTTKNQIYLSNNFWKYFFNKYPVSSLILFFNVNKPADSSTLKNRDNCFTPAITLEMKRLKNLLPNDASMPENEVRFPIFSFFVMPYDSTVKSDKNPNIQNPVAPTLTNQIRTDYQLFKKMLFDTTFSYSLFYKPIISDSIFFWINKNNIKKANSSSGQWNLY